MDKIIVYGSDYGSAKEYALYAEKLVDIKAFGYKDIKAMEHIDSILLIEKLNESSKVEIQREIDRAHYLEKKILGFVIIR